MRRYLVIGATGGLGSAVARLLEGAGHIVRVLVRDEARYRALLPNSAAGVIVGNLFNRDQIQRALVGIDVIFHCADQPLEHQARNLEIARNLIDAIRNVVTAPGALGKPAPHVVLPSNAWVFDPVARRPITPETLVRAPTPLARHKAAADDLFEKSGLPVTTVHLPDFYGPGVVNPIMELIFAAALAGKPTEFPFPCTAAHEYIYIDDAARALIQVGGNPEAIGRRFTVHANSEGTRRHSARAFIQLVHRIAGSKGGVRIASPLQLKWGGLFNAKKRALAQLAPAYEIDARMDGSQLQREFGFLPKTDYPAGIRATLDWYMHNVVSK